MKSRGFIICVVLLVPCYDTQSMIFPVDSSILGTNCERQDGLNGLAKILRNCVHDNPNEFLGQIEGQGVVVCCPEFNKPSIGDKAKAYCTNHSSGTLSPLVNKVIGGNFR